MEKRFIIEGRVVPERVNISLGPIHANFANENSLESYITAQVLLSKITCLIQSSEDFHPIYLRDLALQAISGPIYAYGFLKHHALDIVLDSCTAVHEFSPTVYGVNGGAFTIPAIYPGMTFSPKDDDADFPLPPPIIISNAHFQRAIYELNAAVKNPQLTTLHCKLAIEAVRNAFFGPSETEIWANMRHQLRLSEPRLRQLDEKSGQLRHGRSVQYALGERERDLQIAWEVVHRYMLWLENPEYPLTAEIF